MGRGVKPFGAESIPIGASRFIGSSPQAELIRYRIRRVASSQATVLITGETGTGKELVARAIHEESGRAEFVAAAVTELCDGVLESELFGHERGAFTGAVTRHTGLFEQADQGTLFLDEIGDAPRFLQAKLLRVLETGEVRPVGGGRVRQTRPRVIVATHRDLESMVRDGTFRRDLYYRIRQISIHIPPLRERPADIEPIARTLLADLARDEGHAPPPMFPHAWTTLSSQAWPGNVRELRSVLLNALLSWDGVSALGSASPGEAWAPWVVRGSPEDCVDPIVTASDGVITR
jgi:DNA-binding NtrC family response regulator